MKEQEELIRQRWVTRRRAFHERWARAKALRYKCIQWKLVSPWIAALASSSLCLHPAGITIPLKARSDPVTASSQALECFTFHTMEKPEVLTKNYKTLHDLALCHLCAHSTTHSPPTLTPPATPAPPCPQYTQKERLIIQSCPNLCNHMGCSSVKSSGP